MIRTETWRVVQLYDGLHSDTAGVVARGELSDTARAGDLVEVLQRLLVRRLVEANVETVGNTPLVKRCSPTIPRNVGDVACR
jgi:hypothetical protein